MNSTLEIDIGMIVVAAVANMAIGMFWYSPKVFGKKWMKLIGIKASYKSKNMGPIYALSFVSSLVVAFALEIFLSNFSDAGAFTGIMVGLWAGIGFVATTHLTNHLFNPHRTTNELYFINVGYHVISMMVMGFLLGI